MVILLCKTIKLAGLLMYKHINWLFSKSQNIITIGSIILAIASWFFLMNAIPERVNVLEKDVSTLKTTLAKESTKTDMILSSVYEIRSVLLKRP